MRKWKMKKYIPWGMYCYTVISVEYNQSGRPIIKTKLCPWFKMIGTKIVEGEYKGQKFTEKIGVYKCEYLKYVDHDGSSLLWDRCKECGVHYGKLT